MSGATPAGEDGPPLDALWHQLELPARRPGSPVPLIVAAGSLIAGGRIAGALEPLTLMACAAPLAWMAVLRARRDPRWTTLSPTAVRELTAAAPRRATRDAPSPATQVGAVSALGLACLMAPLVYALGAAAALAGASWAAYRLGWLRLDTVLLVWPDRLAAVDREAALPLRFAEVTRVQLGPSRTRLWTRGGPTLALSSELAESASEAFHAGPAAWVEDLLTPVAERLAAVLREGERVTIRESRRAQAGLVAGLGCGLPLLLAGGGLISPDLFMLFLMTPIYWVMLVVYGVVLIGLFGASLSGVSPIALDAAGVHGAGGLHLSWGPELRCERRGDRLVMSDGERSLAISAHAIDACLLPRLCRLMAS